MNMILYQYNGDPRVLNKYLTQIATVDIIAITNDTDILAPSIIISTRAFNFNYVYIPNFNRYYYVNDIKLMSSERVQLNLAVDVLMSHKSAIYNTRVIADRSASNSDPYIIDDKVGSRDKSQVYIRNVGNTPFNTKSYVLTVGGA